MVLVGLMTDWSKEAILAVAEVAKQQITLATAIVAFTVTLTGTVSKRATSDDRRLLIWSWGLYFVSLIAGVLVLFALTAEIGLAVEENRTPTIFAEPLMLYARGQQMFFLLATCVAIAYGVRVTLNLPQRKVKRPSN